MSTKSNPQPNDHSLRHIKQLAGDITAPKEKLTTQCMLILFSALEVGADVDRLVERTGYSRELIEAISVRMRKAGLWIGKWVDDTVWWDPKGDLTSDFYAHAQIAQGLLLREWTKDGRFRYLDAATGEVVRDWSALDYGAEVRQGIRTLLD